jgi:hypothetical protein
VYRKSYPAISGSEAFRGRGVVERYARLTCAVDQIAALASHSKKHRFVGVYGLLFGFVREKIKFARGVELFRTSFALEQIITGIGTLPFIALIFYT